MSCQNCKDCGSCPNKKTLPCRVSFCLDRIPLEGTLNGLCPRCDAVWVQSPERERAINNPDADYDSCVGDFCDRFGHDGPSR